MIYAKVFKWANLENEEYEELTKEEIYNFIKNVGVKNVTITGGEPLLQEGIYELLEYISKDKDISIEIETNGSVSISRFKKISNRISFTVDYKTNYSKMESFMNLENFDYVNNAPNLESSPFAVFFLALFKDEDSSQINISKLILQF